MDALTAGGIAKEEKATLTFHSREIPAASFAFVLHSEFPEPGMYTFEQVETNKAIRQMLWKAEQIVPTLYELRNMRLLSKVSEIDSFKQLTTKYDLANLVDQLVEARAKV